MLLLVEICAVVASLALVVFAIATVRAMYCVEKAMGQLSKLTGEIQQWIGQANEFTCEAREAVASVRGVVAPLRRVAERFETLGGRTADLSAVLLGEIEPSLRSAVAVARGVRTGTAFLLERLSHRITHGRSATNGGSDSE